MRVPRKIAIGFQEGTCPLRCNKCLAFGKKISKQKKVCKMPLDKAKTLINEIAEMEEIPLIQPYIYTEPFANPDLPEIIQYCNECNIAMSIITNGILIDDRWVDFLVENTNSRYTISFSLDAISQDTYEKVRGKYELAHIEEQIDKLIEKRGSGGPRITVNFTVEEDNDKETLAFIEKWKYKVDGVRATIGVDAQRRVPDKYRKDKFNSGVINKKCGYLDEIMVIDADGHVRSCSFDAFGDSDFGDVFETGILAIWNSERMIEHREMQAQGKLSKDDFCVGCEAGSGAMKHSRVTENLIINEGDYAIYYNLKERYNLSLR